MATTFKRRVLDPSRAAEVEAATSGIPLSGEVLARAPAAEPGATPQLAVQQAPLPKVVPGQLALHGAGTVPESRYTVGQVYEVPLNALSSNPVNPRALYTATAVDAMATSLATNGQRVAATGYIGSAGEVVLIEGETRLRGARAAGLPTLRIEIRTRPANERALYEEARAINAERRDQNPLDDAIRWKDLLFRGVYPTQKSLGQAVGFSEELTSRILSLASLSSRVVTTVAEYPDLLTLKMLTAIREYWEATDDERTLELILDIVKNGLGAREVTSRRMAVQRGPVSRPRSDREHVEYKGAKGELRSFAGTGRVELVLKGLQPAAAEDLAQKLRDIFSTK